MTTLLVTSTEDGTGKTAITVALAKLAQEQGATVGYMKPKGTRLESAVGKTRDQDPMLAREILGIDAEMHQLEPIVYSPTFVQEAIRGREDPDALRDRIRENFEKLSAETNVMLVEGGGKISTGAIVNLTDVDVAELLDAEVLLVSDYTEPRDLDDLLAGTADIGDRLHGVLFNDITVSEYDDLTDNTIPFLNGRDIETVGTVSHDDELSGVTVGELAENLGAEILTKDVSTDRRIQRFSVGAMGSSAALDQFRRARNGAVITGGDRSDIQTTALEASGVQCLVLTGGYRPSNTIIGKAVDRDVPVLLVQSDTRKTIDRTERVLRSGRTQRAETVEQMAELLKESVDIGDLLDLN